MCRRALPVICVAVIAVVAAAAAASRPSAATERPLLPAWTTYRHDPARSGVDPDSAHPVPPRQTWQTPQLDGDIYTQPLVYGPYVYVATENDTVYKLDAGTGAVVWSRHLGTPQAASGTCTAINPMIGITGTPVIDPATGRIYAVGAVTAGDGAVRHELFALHLSSGAPVKGFPITVDPPLPPAGNPALQLQRPALALDDGRILIGYGSLGSNCGSYWGWLVSAPTNGSRHVTAFRADRQAHGGSIWGGGDAPVVDSQGDVFIATADAVVARPDQPGAAYTSTAKPAYDEAVVELNARAAPLAWWTPPSWHILDISDADLGSSMPTLLPDGYLFQSGKGPNGYLVNSSHLDGVARAPVTVPDVCAKTSSYGGSIFDPVNSLLYLSCGGGLRAVSLSKGSPPRLARKPGFSAPQGWSGPPTLAGGLVWTVYYQSGTLDGLDPATGAVRSQFPVPELGAALVNHFESPSAGGGRLFVATGDQVTAFRIAHPPRAHK